MSGFLVTNLKEQCFGCESCVQVCPKRALRMEEDQEGFQYPVLDDSLCVHCGLCNKVCPYENMPVTSKNEKYVFGGYIKDNMVRANSTSGGAFSAIAQAFCDENYVIFGASSKGLTVYHAHITDISQLKRFRKSKYSQSIIGTAYKDAKQFLEAGKRVLFSGTPCQIAGLKAFLGEKQYDNLLTVEVICEGVPSPLYVRKLDKHFQKKYGSSIAALDYRYKDVISAGKSLESPIAAKWDFEVMRASLQSHKKIKIDRWFNPFWSIWLQHLMSRPSCYKCPFTTTERQADISLGDLWGVHLYCPELYGKNAGASLVVCNTEKGKAIVKAAEAHMFGHELDFETALKYQGPMRKPIDDNPDRDHFMEELQSDKYDYVSLTQKWAKKPTAKLLWQKYVWGNRQKVFVWNLLHRKDN